MPTTTCMIKMTDHENTSVLCSLYYCFRNQYFLFCSKTVKYQNVHAKSHIRSEHTHTTSLAVLFSIIKTCLLLHISELYTKLRASALFHEQVKLIHTERITRKIQFDGCLPKVGSCIGNKMGDRVFRQPPLLYRIWHPWLLYNHNGGVQKPYDSALRHRLALHSSTSDGDNKFVCVCGTYLSYKAWNTHPSCIISHRLACTY